MSKPSRDTDSSSSQKPKRRPSLPGTDVSKGNSSVQTSKSVKSKLLKQAQQHPLEELLGPVVKHSNGETVSPKVLAGEGGVIGLYFAAHWCPPCKIMTPQLAVLHDELKKKDKKFDIVFISFDYKEETFTQYFSKMPWYAIDFSDNDKREEVAEHFGIRGIPMLIFLDSSSYEIITMNGRELVFLDPMGELFPWKLEEMSMIMVNDSQSGQDMAATSAVQQPPKIESDVKPAGSECVVREDTPGAESSEAKSE